MLDILMSSFVDKGLKLTPTFIPWQGTQHSLFFSNFPPFSFFGKYMFQKIVPFHPKGSCSTVHTEHRYHSHATEMQPFLGWESLQNRLIFIAPFYLFGHRETKNLLVSMPINFRARLKRKCQGKNRIRNAFTLKLFWNMRGLQYPVSAFSRYC